MTFFWYVVFCSGGGDDGGEGGGVVFEESWARRIGEVFSGGSIAAMVLSLLGLVVGLSVVLCEVGFVMLSVVSVWVSVFSSMWCLKVEAFGFAMCGFFFWMFGCSSGAMM